MTTAAVTAYVQSVPAQVTLRDRLATLREAIVSKTLRGEGVPTSEAEWLRRCRQLGGSKLSRQGLKKYLAGGSKTIIYETLLALADAANVDRAWLLLGEDLTPRTRTAGLAERRESLREALRRVEAEMGIETASPELSRPETVSPDAAATLAVRSQSRWKPDRSGDAKRDATDLSVLRKSKK